MKINKERCVHFFNNDVFILENMGKYLLINDQYNNLKLLDFSLNTTGDIPIKVSLPGYDLLKSCNNDFIAFFDPDEEALLIVNILTKKYPIKEDIDACHKTFIYQDEKQNEAVYFDYNTNKKNSIKTPENLEYHDLIYKNGIFAFIAEEAIVLTDGKEECRLLQSPDEFCKRARFIEHDNKLFLIVLLSNMYNLELTKIVKYQVIR